MPDYHHYRLLCAALSVRWLVPGVWAYAAFITANNYLAAQKIVQPQMVTGGIVLLLHPAVTWLCIHPLGIGCLLHGLIRAFALSHQSCLWSCEYACDCTSSILSKEHIQTWALSSHVWHQCHVYYNQHDMQAAILSMQAACWSQHTFGHSKLFFPLSCCTVCPIHITLHNATCLACRVGLQWCRIGNINIFLAAVLLPDNLDCAV